jgi:thiol:disulfide interchange protein
MEFIVIGIVAAIAIAFFCIGLGLFLAICAFPLLIAFGLMAKQSDNERKD